MPPTNETDAMTTTQVPPWTALEAELVAPPLRCDLIVEALDDQVVLSDPVDGAIHRLNQTALLVLRQCDGRTTTRQIARTLTQAYDVAFDAALDHVDQLMALFAELHLLDAQDES